MHEPPNNSPVEVTWESATAMPQRSDSFMGNGKLDRRHRNAPSICTELLLESTSNRLPTAWNCCCQKQEQNDRFPLPSGQSERLSRCRHQQHFAFGVLSWQPSSLAKKLIWIYNHINEKLESKSNSLHAVYKCCCQKQNKKLCFTFCPLTDWPVFSMSTTTTSWIWGRASGIWIPLPKNISGYTTISTKSSNPRRNALRLYVTAAPKSNGKSRWHLRLTE